MNFAKRISLLAALSAASSALAVDVANVQMAQNTVNCNVTITYELSGPAVVTLDNPPDYMVVDISSAAQPNTQRYYPGVDFLPGGLLENGDYRESSLVMRKVPAAGVEWTMGSVAEDGRNATKEATHKVRLDANYYLGVFEVTQSQYALVKEGTTRAEPSSYKYEADKKFRPVEKVCYNELRCSNGSTSPVIGNYWPNDPHSNSFLGRLRAKTGIPFDLPGEAQWEFACRAGNGEGKWGDGSDYLSRTTDANLAVLACYGRAAPANNSGDYPAVAAADGGTMPVGSFAPNAWGFYDMNGNVMEICLDWFENDISGFGGAVNIDPANPSLPLSGTAASYHVQRGGAFRSSASACRAASRAEEISNGQYNYVGLRVACPASVE